LPSPSNTRSRRFYELIGFDLDEGVTDDWRGIATVRYRRRLDGGDSGGSTSPPPH